MRCDLWWGIGISQSVEGGSPDFFMLMREDC